MKRLGAVRHTSAHVSRTGRQVGEGLRPWRGSSTAMAILGAIWGCWLGVDAGVRLASPKKQRGASFGGGDLRKCNCFGRSEHVCVGGGGATVQVALLGCLKPCPRRMSRAALLAPCRFNIARERGDVGGSWRRSRRDGARAIGSSRQLASTGVPASRVAAVGTGGVVLCLPPCALLEARAICRKAHSQHTSQHLNPIVKSDRPGRGRPDAQCRAPGPAPGVQYRAHHPGLPSSVPGFPLYWDLARFRIF